MSRCTSLVTIPRVAGSLAALVAVLVVTLVVGTPRASSFGQLPISTGDGGWVWQNPVPQGRPLLGVAWADADTVCIVGEKLPVMLSTDAGSTWQLSRLTSGGVGGSLYQEIDFVSPLEGWAAGNFAVTHTTDGGRTWSDPVAGPGIGAEGMDFCDPLHGWVVGDTAVMATTDGGASWVAQDPGVSVQWAEIEFVDAGHGWLIGKAGTILHTVDGGVTWAPQVSGTTEDLCGTSFQDALHGWVSGRGGMVLQTTDGGEHWVSRDAGIVGDVQAVCFSDAAHGWVVANWGQVRATTDGGVTWATQDSHASVDLRDIAFADAQHGCLVGASGVQMTTSDGGATWNGPGGPLTSSSVKDLDFADGDHGWAVGGFDSGGNASIFATSDGGATWHAANSPSTQWYESVFAVDAQTVWAVGADGAIAVTTDGGGAWTSRSAGIATGLGAVTFADAARGWIGSDAGEIIATTDGGATWAAQASGQTTPIRNLAFTDAAHGWAVGDFAGLLRTTDAGAIWTTQDDGSSATRFAAIVFADPLHGWAAGYDDATSYPVLLATTDGGTTWVEQESGFGHEEPPADLACADASHVWLVGRGGVAATVDGGASWSRQDRGYDGWTETVAATPGGEAWIAGEYGFILHSGWGGAMDRTPPHTTPNGGGDWHNTPQTLTFTPVDFVSGVLATEYRVDGGPWTAGTTTAAIGTEGNHIVLYRSADAAGNIEDAHATTVGIDTTAPYTSRPDPQDVWHNHSVTVSLQAGDSGSGVLATYYRFGADGAWMPGPDFTVEARSDHASDGEHPVEFYSVDNALNQETAGTTTVRIDTRRPATRAPRSASVRRGRTATLYYRVDDGTITCGQATVVIRIRTLGGRTVKTLTPGLGATNTLRHAHFRCRLARGTYRFFVYATDNAGNRQASVGRNRLVVR